MSEADVKECTIGICARNEESTIYQCLESVRTAYYLSLITYRFGIGVNYVPSRIRIQRSA